MKALEKQENRKELKQLYRAAISEMLAQIKNEDYLKRIYRLTAFLYTK